MSLRNALVACCSLLLVTFVGADVNAAANPAGIAWKYVTNVSLYGKPTGMLIAGRCNYKDPAFASARAKGAEVLAYLLPVSRPDQRVCDLDTKFYMNDLGQVPLWPYPTYGQRSDWPNTRMTDMRPGSPWILHVVRHVEAMMREGKVDGVFLDVVGVRPWHSLAEWGSWPQWERDRWTDGNVDLVRRLDARRRAINPKFIIMTNNVWEYSTFTRGRIGERYVDGVSLEHPRAGSPWHIKYAARPFGNLGHRRVLVIASSAEEARGWARVTGVTHVSSQTSSQYRYPPAPAVSFTPLNDR